MSEEYIMGRGKGEYYVLGARDNPTLHKPKYASGKRYIYYAFGLKKTKAEARRTAQELRDRMHLAIVVPMKVWMKKRGYEFGVDKFKVYVVYVHYRESVLHDPEVKASIRRAEKNRAKNYFLDTMKGLEKSRGG